MPGHWPSENTAYWTDRRFRMHDPQNDTMTRRVYREPGDVISAEPVWCVSMFGEMPHPGIVAVSEG